MPSGRIPRGADVSAPWRAWKGAGAFRLYGAEAPVGHAIADRPGQAIRE